MSKADAPSRFDRLSDWADQRHPGQVTQVTLAAGDASFRRYYRVTLADGSTRMLMDAPPPQEDIRPFVSIARYWLQAGLPVPEIHGEDAEAGFVELEDLGDEPLNLPLESADETTTKKYFDAALTLIDELQNRTSPEQLPPYDEEALGRELDLFPQWCLQRWLGMTELPPGWNALRRQLIDCALEQPIVTVHRDYDAMNLMQHDGRLYLIDFQDALAGPISYDLISLLHGRYRRFSSQQRAKWITAFHQRAIADGRLGLDVDAATFTLQVNAMAAQRAIKVLGIFCRLTLRDSREGYLARLPQFLDHLQDSLAELPGHEDFKAWLTNTFTPAMQAGKESAA